MSRPGIQSQWLKGFLDFVFPPLCLGCGEYTEADHSICDTCQKAIDLFEQPICLTCGSMLAADLRCPACRDDALVLYAYGNYTGPLEQIVIQFKFKGIMRPAGFFAEAIASRFGELIKPAEGLVLVPVPLHPTRENRRGYNQAEILARRLSETLGIPMRTDVLTRTKKRRPQARLNHRERAVNIRGVYEVAEVLDDSGSVLLVDDVVTSGATVREASRTLQTAGIDVGGVISIAHAL
ncbi:MAG: ComF family protein [Candidatus Zixiibacteriota bacterium]|nr:MAG: ComF family protein [candidate division Zixibacteria bacterium]